MKTANTKSTLMWKSMLVAILLILVVCGVYLAISSSIDYQIMSYKEKLKNQLYEEYGEYSVSLFVDIKVLRPWYSLSPEHWEYIVELSNNRGRHIYKFKDGFFFESVNESLPPKASYDTGISPESVKSADQFSDEYQIALDVRLEVYNRSFHESLERSLTLQVLQLSLEENTITLRPVGLYLSLCVDSGGETAQCVFAGALKGDIQRGYGGDWKRYGREVRWAEDACLIPLAYVDLGTPALSPCCLYRMKRNSGSSGILTA